MPEDATVAEPASTSTEEDILKAARDARSKRVQDHLDVALASNSTVDPIIDEIGRYVRNEAPYRSTDGNAINWWKLNESLFPTLARLARIVLACPGSTAEVERVFSLAGWFVSNRRARLNGTTLGLLVTSHAWMSQADRLVGLDAAARTAGRPILANVDAMISAEKESRSKRRIQAASS